MQKSYIAPMLSTPPLGGRLFVEPLEQRIAPTNLVAFANHPQDAGTPNYLTYSTLPTAGKLGFVPAANYGVHGGANLFAIALSGDGGTTTGAGGAAVSTGDQIQIFTSDGYKTFFQIAKGATVAFFQDLNGDNQVQTNELVGVSLGKKTQVAINGNVNGDIVTNLDPNGALMGSVGNAKQKIAGLSVTGNVVGNIIAGGNITGVAVSGNVNAIYAGTAANGLVYNFGGSGFTTGAVTAPAPANNALGASITNVSVLSITDVIQSGNGGLNAAGGSISQLTFQGDSDGLKVISGNGGAGTATTHGGAGGFIDTVLVKGAADATANSAILIQSGHGGDNAQGKAGAGGAISGIGTSLDLFTPSTSAIQQSGSLLDDNVLIQGGAGGNGLKGGTGGAVDNSVLFGSVADDNVTTAAGVANAELQVLGGNGGINTVAGVGAKSGKGGVISTVTVENLDTADDAQGSSILLQGGNAGLVQAGGKGKLGGDVGGISLLGTVLTATAGNGSDATGLGGAGGSLTDVKILNLTNLFATNVTLSAGTGGSSSTNSGGAGGVIDGVQVNDSDLAAFTINQGAHGNGGLGMAGKGGAGGSVNNVQINDSGMFRPVPATMAVRSGVGGDGILGGGPGGDINTFQLIGSDIAYNLTAGGGGSVTTGGIGKGGAGGSVLSAGLSNQPADTTNTNFAAGATGTVTAGNGGNGQSKGGIGGQLNLVDLQAAYDVAFTAGNGGTGITKTAGAGGSILGSGGISLLGGVTVASGNGGAQGAGPADGGTIDGFVAAASTTVSMISGAGGVGGAGGSITGSGISNVPVAPSGSVTITAGAGSAANGVAGAGGSISFFNGSVGLSGTTSFTAGKGGGGTAAGASGAGGSIDQVKLTGPAGIGANPVSITFDAGDAGSGGAKRGAAGGSVTNVTLFNLATSTVVHHLAAGDGANGVKHGGAGGAISDVNVGIAGEATGDIGIRSGVAYGYNLNGGAGGLFAGVGGTGSKNNGSPGDVMNITAKAISSIAAGKAATPQLAGTVDNIFLNGSAANVLISPTADNTGAFTNFDTANLVGSVQNPTAAGASTYKTGDGVIAARVVGQNKNFKPEATLTLDVLGNLVLADYQEPSGNVVVTPV